MLRILYVVAALSMTWTPVNADTVELVNGDQLHGTVVEQTPQQIVLEHPVLGRIKLPADQVNAVVVAPDEAETPATETPKPTDAPQPGQNKSASASISTSNPGQADAGKQNDLPHRLLPGWDKHFELGFTGSDGNSQTFNLNSRFTASREDEQDRWKFDAAYFRTQDDGSRTRNELTGELVRDWLMPDSPWFKFANAKLEYDEFQDWETRTSGFLGIGKTLRDSPKHKLAGRAGLGGSYEFGVVNELVPEAMFGLEWAYQINDRQTLISHATVFPDLDEFGESRTLAGVAWLIELDHADGLSLKLGIDDEYESTTEGPADHNDVKYYGALVYDF